TAHSTSCGTATGAAAPHVRRRRFTFRAELLRPHTVRSAAARFTNYQKDRSLHLALRLLCPHAGRAGIDRRIGQAGQEGRHTSGHEITAARARKRVRRIDFFRRLKARTTARVGTRKGSEMKPRSRTIAKEFERRLREARREVWRTMVGTEAELSALEVPNAA